MIFDNIINVTPRMTPLFLHLGTSKVNKYFLYLMMDGELRKYQKRLSQRVKASLNRNALS